MGRSSALFLPLSVHLPPCSRGSGTPRQPSILLCLERVWTEHAWELLVMEPQAWEASCAWQVSQARPLIHPMVSSSLRLGRDSGELGGGRPATSPALIWLSLCLAESPALCAGRAWPDHSWRGCQASLWLYLTSSLRTLCGRANERFCCCLCLLCRPSLQASVLSCSLLTVERSEGKLLAGAGKPGSWLQRRPQPETEHNDHLALARGRGREIPVFCQ